MASDERLLELDDLVETDVGVEVGLDLREYRNGAISTSTTVKEANISDLRVRMDKC